MKSESKKTVLTSEGSYKRKGGGGGGCTDPLRGLGLVVVHCPRNLVPA